MRRIESVKEKGDCARMDPALSRDARVIVARQKLMIPSFPGIGDFLQDSTAGHCGRGHFPCARILLESRRASGIYLAPRKQCCLLFIRGWLIRG